MFKRVWLLRCTMCLIVYGFSNQEITIEDGTPYGVADDPDDRKPLHCRVCGHELEVLQQVGEW